MSFQALYRKYRPQTFDEVIGQDHIVKALANQVKNNQVSHAYLFTGTRGTGKTSSAKIFAKAINCENNVNGSPCGKCPTCIALSQASNMDVLEIDAASNNRVDEVRDIREKVKFPPVNGKYKVYIIDEVHMLTDSAFNALLKTLEEPPAHAVFILATTEVHKLPQTIISRCMRFDFKLVAVSELVKLLRKVFTEENISFEDEALEVIAAAGEGSVRDTLSIADCISSFSGGNITLESALNVLGLNDKDMILKFANAIIKKDIGEGLEIVNDVVLSGKNISVFAKDMSVHFRNLLTIKTCKNPNTILNLPKELYEKYEAQAQTANITELLRFMKVFSSIEAELKYALSPRILVETAMVNAIGDDLPDEKKN